MAWNKRKTLEAARKFAQKGAQEKALKEYGKLLRSDPQDAKLRLEIGDAYRRWGQTAEAIDTYTKVAEQYTREGFDARAVAVYKQIQNLDPQRLAVFEPLAELYQRMGLTAEAVLALQTAAEGYKRAGEKGETIGLLRKMAALDPGNTTSRLKVADLLRQEGMLADAVSEYTEVAAELERQGDAETAVRAWERILEIEPQNAEVLTQLVRAQIGLGAADRAEAHARRAVEATVGSPESYEQLAEVYRQQGKQAEMVDTYRSLAEMHKQRGDIERSREIMQRYVSVAGIEETPDELEGADLFGAPVSFDGGSEPEPGAGPEPRLLGEDTVLDQPALGFDVGSARPAEPQAGDVSSLLEDDFLADEPLLDVAAGPAAEQTRFAASGPEIELGDDLGDDLGDLGDIELDDLGDVPLDAGDADEETRHGAPAEPVDLDQLLAEATVYLRYGKNAQAADNLERVLRQDPERRAALDRLGEVRAQQGESEQAVQLWLRAAQGAHRDGDTGAEAELRERIAALDPAAAARLGPPAPQPAVADEMDFGPIDIEPDAVEGSSLADLAARETPAAAVSASHSLSQQILEDLEEADFYLQQGLLDEAEVIYARLLKVAPNHPRALVRMGEIAAARGEDPAAATGPGEDEDTACLVLDAGVASRAAAAAEPAASERAPAPDPVSGAEIEFEFDPADLEAAFAPDPEPELRPAPTPEPAAEPAPAPAPEPVAEPLLDLELEPELEAALRSEPEPVRSIAEPVVAPPAPAPAASRPVAARPAPPAPAGGGFDLAAELAEAMDADPDPDSTTSAGDTREEGFAAVFEEFKQGVKESLSEVDHEAHYDLGIAYREMELLDDAVQEFQLAAQSVERRVDSLHMLGLCCLDLGRSQQAIDHFQQALGSESVTREQGLAVRFELGRAFEGVGDMQGARETYEAVAGVDPLFCNVEERLARLDDLAKPDEELAPADSDFESFEDVIAEADPGEPPSAPAEPPPRRRKRISFL